MGLGKTLSTIALILKQQQDKEDDDKEDSDTDDEEIEGAWSTKGRKDLPHGGTLIICPASLIKQWEQEIVKHVKRGVLTVNLFHGPKREYRPRRLAKDDVVITSYHTVLFEHKNNGCLFGVKWQRIILDEAHTIRNHKSQSSISVCELTARYRWALTGTPIQNKEFDMFAIVKFLRCSPFDDISYWKTWIDGNRGAGGSARLAAVMKSILLRRTKEQLVETGELKSLPTKTIHQIDLELSKPEKFVYTKVLTYSQTLFAQFLVQRSEKNNDLALHLGSDMANVHKLHKKYSKMFGNTEVNASEILTLLLRLRQICCHSGLISAMLDKDAADEIEGHDESHGNAATDLVSQLENLNINEEVNEDDMNEDVASKHFRLSNPVFDMTMPSSKIIKMMEVLQEHVISAGEKAIVVSQWVGFLNIIGSMLREQGFSYCELNGSVPVKNRNDIVVNFNDPKSEEKVMLLSLTAGGVGLNLVGANHLFLMDLHWNPQLESQAQDRIYRFGQKRPVNIYKFITKETVEVRILAMQQKKLEIANSCLTGAKKTATKLTIEDLKSLFSL